jgi:hypothetical protein
MYYMVDPSPRRRRPEAEFPVTDAKLDAPDGSILYDEDRKAWYERSLDRWKLRADVQVLSVSKLQAVANPFRHDPWEIGPLTRLAITRAVNCLRRQKHFRGGKPMAGSCRAMEGGRRVRRRWHIERVAWLVVYGWEDPIEIDVGVPFLGCFPEWIVQDGNHRLAAAIYLGRKTILASCGGQQSVIDEYR